MKKVLSDTSIEQDIMDLNREDQLYDKGINAEGASLGEYSAATIYGTSNFEGKIQKGQRYDHITLKDTGELYASEKFVFTASGFKLTMNTSIHGEDLSRQFGNIVGLTQQNTNVVYGWVKAPFINEIRKGLFI